MEYNDLLYDIGIGSLLHAEALPILEIKLPRILPI
jgi:hypothetical protein